MTQSHKRYINRAIYVTGPWSEKIPMLNKLLCQKLFIKHLLCVSDTCATMYILLLIFALYLFEFFLVYKEYYSIHYIRT